MMASRFRASQRHGGAVRTTMLTGALILCGGAMPGAAAGFIASIRRLNHSIPCILFTSFSWGVLGLCRKPVRDSIG